MTSNASDFNPRSRVGNDVKQITDNRLSIISIHVPAWGTTLLMCQAQNPQQFQSTFPRGERQQDYYSHLLPH